MANKGKNKLTRYIRAYVGGYELSGNMRSFGAANGNFEPVDATTVADSVRPYYASQRLNVGVTGFQAILDDTSGAGAFDVLSDGGSHAVSIVFGGNAEPELGDVAYLLPGINFGRAASFDAQLGILTLDMLPDAGQSPNDNPYGVIVQPDATISATANGTSVDEAASTANGAHAVLHILSTSSGDFEFKIQDSANDSTWADLITFTIDGSAVASEYLKVSGTVDRYIRFVSTRTAGSVVAICTMARTLFNP